MLWRILFTVFLWSDLINWTIISIIKKYDYFVQRLLNSLLDRFWRFWASNDRWRMVQCPFKKKIEVFEELHCKKCNFRFALPVICARRLLEANRFFSYTWRYFLVSLSFDVELFIFPHARCCFIYKYQRVDDRWAKCWHNIWLFISLDEQPRFNLKSIVFDKFVDTADISLHIFIFYFC